MTKNILVVEDSASMAALCQEYLEKAGYRALLVGDGAAALRAVEDGLAHAVLLDYELPDMTGVDVLRELQARVPDMVVIMMTAHANVEAAAEAMRLGAHDFLQKPFPAARLTVTLKNALEKHLYRQELQQILAAQAGQGFGPFIGKSPVMQAVYRTIQHVAPSRVPVFITGESGTGKELAAEALHSSSPRHVRPFRTLNCGAVPANLLESELFGHVKGAFTGATQDRLGLLQQADGGTVFLDEVADMPLDLQVKLLRAVQTQTLRPVGSDKDVTVNVRFVAATNRDVLAEVQAGNFREDLFYRLYVVPLEMPRLAERGEDITQLAQHFLRRYAAEEKKSIDGFSPEVLQLFLAYPWPGNVRELENTVRHAVALCGYNGQQRHITLDLLPASMQGVSNTPVLLPLASSASSQGTAQSGQQNGPSASHKLGLHSPILRPLHELERAAITAALQSTGEDVGRAAAILEISPSTIYRKLESWRKSMA